MDKSVTAVVWLMGLAACSDAESEPAAAQNPAQARPVLASNPAGPTLLTTFVDPETGYRSSDVHDVDRQVVHFDSSTQAMVWAANGNAVGGWASDGNDLRWSRGGAFRVSFGTEAGERRAYFTEAGPGTICDLEISAPGQLNISPSNETPPQP